MNGSLESSAGSQASILDQMAVLGDQVRCRILLLCEREQLAVSELCKVLQLPQSTVSRHLKTLAEDGWVEAQKDGTSRRYSAMARGESAAVDLWKIIRDELSGSPTSQEDQRRLVGILSRRPTRSQEFFSTAAGRWTELRHEFFGQRFDLEAALAFLDDRWTLGDLGCGTGDLAAAMARHVQNVVAVDESPEMLTAASKRVAAFDNVHVRPGKLEDLPIEDGELDAATMVLVLHHVANPRDVLTEAARCLRPGGQILVVDMLPHERDEFRIEMGHVWMGFGGAQIQTWLEQAGFERIRFRALSTQPDAQGPSLFAASGAKPVAEAIELPQRMITDRKSGRS